MPESMLQAASLNMFCTWLYVRWYEGLPAERSRLSRLMLYKRFMLT